MSVTKPEVKFTEVIHIQQVYEDVSDSVNPELKNTGDYKWYPQPAIRHTYGITTSPSSSVHKVFIKSVLWPWGQRSLRLKPIWPISLQAGERRKKQQFASFPNLPKRSQKSICTGWVTAFPRRGFTFVTISILETEAQRHSFTVCSLETEKGA